MAIAWEWLMYTGKLVFAQLMEAKGTTAYVGFSGRRRH